MPFVESALVRRGSSEPARDAPAVLGIVLIAAVTFSLMVGAAAVVFVCLNPPGCTLRRTPTRDATAINSAATLWVAEHAGSCPMVADLVADGLLRPHQAVLDPQGRPFSIACDGDSITTASPGVDGIFGTADDINV